MNNRMMGWRRWLAMVVVIVGLMVAALAPGAQADSPPPPLAPADPSSYKELSAKWWQWALTKTNLGGECYTPQSGPVWFLAGIFQPGPALTCTIPAGTKLFFPVINSEWSVAEANLGGWLGDTCQVIATPTGTSHEALRACAVALADHFGDIHASLDGVPLTAYRVQSPPFKFNAVEGNSVFVPAGESNAVSDGYWIELAPLSVGEHTLTFGATGDFPELGFSFTIDTTYHLIVTP
jgi:hypothetical protein